MKKANLRWIFRITLISLIVSAVFALTSTTALEGAGYVVSFIILALFIIIGLAFDTIGMSVAAAASNEAPFNSMATRRQRGAAESLRLLRNANRVSCYCADVIGDVTGIVSGTISALIAARLIGSTGNDTLFFPVLITATVTAITVGGKAAGKALAFTKSTDIVLGVGKLFNLFHIMPYSKQDKQERQDKQVKQDDE